MLREFIKKFKTMDKSYANFVENLNRIMDNYRSALAQISYSSQRVLTIAQDLANATDETCHSINEIAQSIEKYQLAQMYKAK